MTQAIAVRHTAVLQGLHRFRPDRDLESVAILLRQAFGDELDPQDQRFLADLGALSSGSWWVRALLRWLPAGRGLFSGFVWYEQGRLVANVSLMRLGDGRWVIANVATHPSHQRRGIAHALMTAAIDEAAAGGARVVGLQVRSDNDAARRLYLKLGFQRAGAATTFRMRLSEADPVAALDEEPVDRTNAEVVTWAASNKRAVRGMLARAGALSGPWPPGPMRQMVHGQGLGARLEETLRERRRKGWVVMFQGVPRAAVVVFVAGLDEQHSIEATVDPPFRGRWEGLLLDLALAAAGRGAAVPVVVEVPEDETAVAAALDRRGFRPVRTLERYVLPMR